MNGYQLGGIQQVGIGVTNLAESWNWYNRHFGMDCRIFEDKTEARLMLLFTGGKPVKRHAILVLNLQSGGGFEVWQYTERTPLQAGREINLSDFGLLICKVKVKNTEQAFSYFTEKKCMILGKPMEDPAGKKTFFIKDPFGNIFQMVEGNNWFMNENKVTGGSYGLVIGVSDIERSKTVYSEILGYDRVVYDTIGMFPDLSHLPGGQYKIRRVLLSRSKPFYGYFSPIFGQSVIELVSTPGTLGSRTYEGRLWGDPGFIHLCFDTYEMDELKKTCASRGFPFVVDSKDTKSGGSFDMGEAAGRFAYIQDPDGILIEFVESHKMPVSRRLGWYINLRKRGSYKPLPVWLLKALRFSRKKPVEL